MKGAWAIDHQIVNAITREDRLHGDGAFWALSNGAAIPVPRAMQFVASGSLDMRGCCSTSTRTRRSSTI